MLQLTFTQVKNGRNFPCRKKMDITVNIKRGPTSNILNNTHWQQKHAPKVHKSVYDINLISSYFKSPIKLYINTYLV